MKLTEYKNAAGETEYKTSDGKIISATEVTELISICDRMDSATSRLDELTVTMQEMIARHANK